MVLRGALEKRYKNPYKLWFEVMGEIRDQVCQATDETNAEGLRAEEETMRAFSDDDIVGDFHNFERPDYEEIHRGLEELADELERWNDETIKGGGKPPYAAQAQRVRDMVTYGSDRLAQAAKQDCYWVDIGAGVTVGSVRLWKAALLLRAHRQRLGLASKEGFPSQVRESLEKTAADLETLASKWPYPPAAVLEEVIGVSTTRMTLPEQTLSIRERSAAAVSWDVFISHASEDKEAVAGPLSEALRALGLKVWYDDYTLRLGDSLRRSIDKGLKRSRYGVVILSPHFFEKEWPQKELDGMTSLEVEGRKVILPVWHEVSRDDVLKFSPTLADRIAVSTSKGLSRVAREIRSVLEG